jgi:hypothetical protein
MVCAVMCPDSGLGMLQSGIGAKFYGSASERVLGAL